MKTVYYAHPMALYGSFTERVDLSVLRDLGFKVLNPALAKYSRLDMDGFIKLACSCDLVAFRAFEDGKIGSGMGLELDAARAKGLPIIEMSGDLSSRVLSRNDTRGRMGLPKLRHPETAPLRTVSDDPAGLRVWTALNERFEEDFGYDDRDFEDQ